MVGHQIVPEAIRAKQRYDVAVGNGRVTQHLIGGMVGDMTVRALYTAADKPKLFAGILVAGLGILMQQWMVIGVGLLLVALGAELVKI